MTLSVYVASAFSKNDQGGNKAGVVLNQDNLTTTQKMAIAKQLGYAEIAFITESSQADFKIDYFTPKEEVNLCGHATIGSFAILMHLNQLTKDNYTIETKSGVLSITIKDDDIFMEQNKPIFYEKIEPQEFEACFDIEAINSDYPIQIVSTGLKDILIPIKSNKALHELAPDFDQIKKISETYDVIGTHLFTMEDDRIICRNFAPLYDIDEESATGTSNAALASYLYEHDFLRRDNYVFEQGYALDSPSEILVRIEANHEHQVEKVFVGGRGYFSEMKELEI